MTHFDIWPLLNEKSYERSGHVTRLVKCNKSSKSSGFVRFQLMMWFATSQMFTMMFCIALRPNRYHRYLLFVYSQTEATLILQFSEDHQIKPPHVMCENVVLS